ncbi:N-acetylglucosaminyl deacetylase, LmbE family [Tenacibaculum sp. MAR_2009_124]|uniref:PIG-L family deacetylase n=1 Tax=Tenacibaculum sp. MAR_2009_124 TaxID=1250059 RepID=UPI00089C7143|nr:PIG-L family deacetylase [Tenacibaculum sp. MAR_2009_124]SEB41270.1 N-acetylglucosaminyl deacetylase, LmbE family [Tenacibaculum sp. MAR_2009_124]
MNKKVTIFLSFLLMTSSIIAQKQQKLTSNQIYEKIQKLNFLGSALYIAAHPDDENTRLIAYLANHDKARTGYLSLTRGDGGQNLIGPEIRELLGVIRTQELLAARNVDGGEQRFSRANDFGYSKHPDETLKIWDKDKVLADVVWTIRTFKPDVIINRFDHRTPGTTHGHHTTSAMLSVEAFDLANDPSKYSDQLSYTEPWQPNRLFFNTSWWFYGSRDNFAKADKSKMLKFDIGTYYPLKGLSNNELASMASSQHLCQGFGRLTTRGSQEEYVEFLKGGFPADKENIFSGINTTWSRVKKGKEIGDILHKVEKEFDFIDPSKHLPELMKAYKLVQGLKNEHWKGIKSKELKAIIKACAGLYLEASAVSSSTTPNSSVKINFEALNRSNIPMEFVSMEIQPQERLLLKNLKLRPNSKENFSETISVGNMKYSAPYWLEKSWDLGMYKVADQREIGNPESKRPFNIKYNLTINGEDISFVKPVVYRYSQRDKGEIYEPFEIVPQVTTKLADKVLIFANGDAQKVNIEVKAGSDNTNGTVKIKAPKGWKVTPEQISFSIEQKGDVQMVDFMIAPTSNESEGYINAIATVNGTIYDKELVEINYDHIPKQTVLLQSKAKVVRLNIKKEGSHIGYIQGSGDAVPESLKQIGYKVTEITPTEINEKTLSKFDAVVVGIRAYNTKKELQFKQKYLLEYVKNGGNMIVQYNTNRRVDVKAPYELKLSRDRVTDEYAKVTMLAKDHKALQYPNKINEKDFEGWVQERGLYFPNSWSKEYVPILSMNDKGESPKKGSLLIAKYGKGNYIYTGVSFFRELPAGVSGAYKLFTNLLSL